MIQFKTTLPEYVFNKKHQYFIFFKSEEFLFYDERLFSIINEIITSIQGHNFVSFFDINNSKAAKNTKVIIRFSDYHKILENMYEDRSSFVLLDSTLESSPYLLFSLMNSDDFEFYEDALLNVGIIGTNESIYNIIIENLKRTKLMDLVWENSDKYLEYIHFQFKEENKYILFKDAFKRNYFYSSL
jgi:hypothetical protein